MTRSLRLVSRLSFASIVALAPTAVTLAQSVSGLADREIMRRYARIEDAKTAIARGDNLFREGNYEDSLASYKSAVSNIPNAPYTAEWLDFAKLKYADCAVVVAKERAKNGRYDESRLLLNEAIADFPEHKNARTLLKQLDDPDRWPPALTAQHVENVEKVQKGLLLANSSVELGNYEQAASQYQEVLRTDPFNSAARRGMENAERKRIEYLRSAYDQTRAKMLRQVDELWEDKVPVRLTPSGAPTTSSRSAGAYLTEKMDKIIFPTVSFANASVDEAIEYLRIKSKDLDLDETDPTRKGVNIILRGGDAPGGSSISLDLKNVPMSEALRYITDLAQMKYKVESYAVVVVPISDNNTEMFTRTYRVPPDFLGQGGGAGAGAAPAPAADPFAAAPAGGGGGLQPKAQAKDVLLGAGITFPDGASASFTAATSTLVVRNTQPNLDLIEAYVEELNKQGPKQVVITTKFVEVTQKNTEELGFDWLLGGVGLQSGSLFAGGGSSGNGVPFTSTNYPFGNAAAIPGIFIGNQQVFPSQPVATAVGGSVPLGVPVANGGGGGPVTAGLRNGGFAINNNSLDNLLSTGSATGTNATAPGIFSMAGIYGNSQVQMVMRGLSQKKGVDLMSAPSVTTKPGARATMEVTREFIYPTEFDPPQLPNNSGGGGAVFTGGGTMIATPTTPTAFEMRPTGVRLEAEPTVGQDGNTIELNLSPEVVEFDGFINYGSPIFSPASFSFAQVVLPAVPPATTQSTAIIPISSGEQLITPNIINQPIFSVRKVTTGVTVWDGQTVVLGGLIREDVQDVEDKVPLLGDIPILGRLFRSESEQHFKRNLMIFVTAYLIDPSGQRIRVGADGGGGPTDSGAGLLLPPVGN
jgi:general secretion pathway protein D